MASPSPPHQLCGRHWTNLLRCPVCFSFFHEPVTLYCGHTFCKGCMRRMAQMIEGNHPDIPIQRLRMWCPTCRQGVAARMFLKNDASISFVLQDLVEGWREERTQLSKSGQVMVHTVSTQTNRSDPSPQHDLHNDLVSKEDSYLKVRSDILYIQAAIFGNDSDNSCGDMNENQQIHPRYSTSESAFEDIQALDEFQFVADENEDQGQGQGQGQLEGDVHPGMQGEWSPSRTLMVIVWATYTLVIMLLAQNYLPYMFLYSVLFLMILYTERLPNANRYAL